MATYQELFDLASNSALRNRIAVAVAVKAHGILGESSPSAGRVDWARSALTSPVSMADSLLRYVLAANKDATVANIEAATDATIQTNVDAAADVLAGA